MANIEIVMPKMGESVMEGTVLEWKKGVGDLVEQDETLLEISTDKVDAEINTALALDNFRWSCGGCNPAVVDSCGVVE